MAKGKLAARNVLADLLGDDEPPTKSKMGKADIKGRSSKANGQKATPIPSKPAPLQAKSVPAPVVARGAVVKKAVPVAEKTPRFESQQFADKQAIKIINTERTFREGSAISVAFELMKKAKTIGDYKKLRVKAGLTGKSPIGGFLPQLVREKVVAVR